MIFVAVIDINITATTGADLNHLVRKILKNDFIVTYTTTKVPTLNAPDKRRSVGRFQSTNTFNAVDLYIAEVI